MFNLFNKNQPKTETAEQKKVMGPTTASKTSSATTDIAKKIRRLEGVVVSDKMKKTVVISIERLKYQAKYRTYYKITQRFKAHDENNEYHIGDKVVIQETRPLSKDKRWIVIKKI